MKTVGISILLAYVTLSAADQPIMNMMPRWDGGYGWQALYERIDRDDLLQGSETFRSGWHERIEQLHVQGVYTWDRSIRLTVKVPIVLEAERVNWVAGQRVVQKDSGLGDITVALPLKKYFNLMKRTGSWTLAPQLRIPVDGADEYEVYDGAWGAGLFAGYETETRAYFFACGVAYWAFEGQEPEEWHASLDLGWNVRDDVQLLWESDGHYETNGKEFVSMGPALYWRFKDEIHSRIEYKRSISAKAPNNQVDHVGGVKLSLGIGLVY